MRLDILGKLRNTKLSPAQGLQPLFETLTNSIQAIQDLGLQYPGAVKIIVERDKLQLTDVRVRSNPIQNIEVIDNGIGFDSINFEAFSVSDTRRRYDKGGKGLGRFTWLKGFDHAEIESIFQEVDTYNKRSFKFKSTELGVEDPVTSVSDEVTRRTSVKLVGFKEDFKKQNTMGQEPLASRIILHLLVYFLYPSSIQFELIDDDSGKPESLNLNNYFAELFEGRVESKSFEILSQPFEIKHLRFGVRHKHTHSIHFYANCREVSNFNLERKMPSLTQKLTDEQGKSFIYLGYVSSPFLDARVNDRRTGFDLTDQLSMDDPESIPAGRIIEDCAAQAFTFLDPYLHELRSAIRGRVEVVINNNAPECKFVLKKLDKHMDKFSIRDSTAEIVETLNRIQFQEEKEAEKKTAELLSNMATEDIQALQPKIQEVIDQIDDSCKGRLAKYVALRHGILRIFAKRVEVSKDGSYPLEEVIHDLIFPRAKTSNQVPIDDQNLWIIDEKLVYHRFLCSDMPLCSTPLDTSSKREPDLMVCDYRFAFSESDEPTTSITIVEFKRPGREQYGKERPINQVLTYIKEIREKKVKKPNQRPINVLPNTPFYCFIICDLTSAVTDEADRHSFIQHPDGLGYFGYVKPYNAYFEIISFNKLISDARKRNQILFDNLGLPKLLL